MANTVGRPTDYRPEYCDKVVELGKMGKSLAHICAEIGVARSTIHLWMNTYPQFSEAIELSRAYAQAWWEDRAQEQVVAPTPGFNASLWGKSMSARFPDDYTDKQKQEVSGTSSLEVKFVGS